MAAPKTPITRSERDPQRIVDAILDLQQRIALLEAGGGAGGARVVGEVADYAGGTPPAGWLLCDGSAVSRATYATLFAAIGTTWGPGDGATTFNLPDMRGRVAAGRDDMGGAAAGRLTIPGSGTQGTLLGETSGDEHLQEHLHVIS